MSGTADESSNIPINGDENSDNQQRSQLENERENALSSAKLFERSRIKALAGIIINSFLIKFYY